MVPLFEQFLHFLFSEAPQRHVEDIVEVWPWWRARAHWAVAIISVIVIFLLSLMERNTKHHTTDTCAASSPFFHHSFCNIQFHKWCTSVSLYCLLIVITTYKYIFMLFILCKFVCVWNIPFPELWPSQPLDQIHILSGPTCGSAHAWICSLLR